MEIRIGDNLVFGGEDSRYQIEPGISGLQSAGIRTGDGLYAGVDGGYISTQLYGFRTITFMGFYVADNCIESDALRTHLLTNLRIRYLYPIFITTFSGNHYFTEAYVTDVKADITGPRANEFQITLVCPDPIIYDGGDGVNSDSAWMEQTFFKEKSGGFDIAYTAPVQWTSGQMISIINNIGTVQTYPIITLRGTFHNPTVLNQTTGSFISIARTTSGTQEITIDMKKRIITLTDSNQNVTSIASSRSLDSSWWYLAPGENRVLLTTTSSSDTNYGMIRYKQGFEGI